MTAGTRTRGYWPAPMASSTCGRASFATVKQSMSNPEHRRLVVDAQTAAIAFAEAMTRLSVFRGSTGVVLPAQRVAGAACVRGSRPEQGCAVIPEQCGAGHGRSRSCRGSHGSGAAGTAGFRCADGAVRLAFTPSASICLRPAGGVRSTLLVFRVVSMTAAGGFLFFEERMTEFSTVFQTAAYRRRRSRCATRSGTGVGVLSQPGDLRRVPATDFLSSRAA